MSKVSELAYTYSETTEDEYQRKQIAYRSVFNSPEGELVLKDLLRVCRYTDCSVTDSGVLNAHHQALKTVIQHIDRMIESEINYGELTNG